MDMQPLPIFLLEKLKSGQGQFYVSETIDKAEPGSGWSWPIIVHEAQ